MFNPNEPLWLPRGSVRAILALALVLPLAFLILTSGVKIGEELVEKVVMVVLTAYFVSKAATANSGR